MKHWVAALALITIVSLPANAAELGYSLLHHNERDDVTTSARGFEAIINFGNSPHSDRYSGDRWTLAIGHVGERESPGDGYIDTPAGCCSLATGIDSYQYLSFTHRWYTRQGRFRFAPRLRLFVGTGVAWKNAETCVLQGCWDGTPAVSQKVTFHQSAGIKWRERLEIAWEHDSTGRISTLNLGDDVLRFTLLAHITKRSRP